MSYIAFSASEAPWYRLPSFRLNAGDRVLVLGAGIAGATSAHALARRGFQVTVLEREDEPARGASGNPAAVILPVTAQKPNPLSRFFLAAYRAVLDQIDGLIRQGADFGWRQTGIVHLLAKPRLRRRYETVAQSGLPPEVARRIGPETVDAVTGLSLSQPALYYELGGFLDPAAFCKAHLARPGITVRFRVNAAVLQREDGLWRATDAAGRVLASGRALIVANGCGVTAFEQTCWLPVVKIRGQMALVPEDWVSPTPKTVICHRGFMVPGVRGHHMLGATWNRESRDPTLDMKDHRQLLAEAAAWIPSFRFQETPPLFGCVAFRAQCKDRLPIVGPVPDRAGFEDRYADLHHGQPRSYPAGPCLPGLYLSAGHGSRGMVSSHLAAELLAAQLAGEPPPLDEDLVAAVHPARFLIRELRKHPRDRKGDRRTES